MLKILIFIYIIFSNHQNTPKYTPILSKSKFFRGGLWYFCQAVKYGRIVTPAITRRLVGWCLPYSSSRPILPFGRLLFVSALSVMRPNKKAYIYKKTQNRLVPLVPMAKSLASHGFHGTKTHILTLVPFGTAPIFWA